MDFNTVETNSFIKDLKCSVCKNYLSYFPIFLTKNNLNICGRCEIPEDPENSDDVVPHIRNEVYETIAKEVTFPCRFINEGCTEKLLGKNVANHENVCPVRLVKCPASLLEACRKMVTLPDVAKHCKEAHAELVFGEKLEIDLAESKNCNNIVIRKEGCFIFKGVFETGSKNLSCTLMSSEYDQMKLETYRLSLQNDCTSILRSFNKHRRASFRTDICLKVFECPGSSSTIKLDLLDPEGGNKTMTSKNEMVETVMKILQCYNCKKMLRPPVQIFFKQNKIFCSSCNGNYIYTFDNDSLNKLAEMLLYPCKYQPNGCSLAFHPFQLTHHESLCSFRPTSCPLPCEWKGLSRDTVSHISTEHPQDIAPSAEFFVQVCDGFGCLNFTKSYILKFASYFFRLCFSSQKDCCRWSVQMIGEFRSEFWYEIELIDVNNRRRMVTTKNCTPLVEEKLLFGNHRDFCYFMLSQFEDMLSKYVLKFRVRIFCQYAKNEDKP